MHNDWSQFFGRFHPLIVHLPIGFILLAALMNIVAANTKNTFLHTAINIALLAGAISAALSAISGYFLSTEGGYNTDTLFWHKWIGFTVTVFTFIVWLLRINNKESKRFLRITVGNWLLSFCIILIIIGGHLGGKMTHGEGYLTRYMPPFLQSIFASKKLTEPKKILPALDSVVVFTDIIQPIFNARCIRCHNADKNKGELNLATVEGILKGGKSGNTIVGGDIEKSELFHRITLPQQSSKFMPSDNRPPLTPVEVNLVKWWIQTGAEYKKNITASGVDEKTKYLIAAYLGIDPENSKEIILPDVSPADSVVIKQLKEMKVIVHSVTSKSNLLDVSFVMVRKDDPALITSILEKLNLIRQQLYRLQVNNCALTKDDLKIISGFTRLQKLEIQKNNLGDESIEPLAALQQVEVLNAGQNSLTDKSIAVFKKMPALKRINLWQTAVSDEGAKGLQSQVNGLIVEK